MADQHSSAMEAVSGEPVSEAVMRETVPREPESVEAVEPAMVPPSGPSSEEARPTEPWRTTCHGDHRQQEDTARQMSARGRTGCCCHSRDALQL